MVQDFIYVFDISGTEAMTTATTAEKLSDAIDTQEKGLNDGGGQCYVVVHCTDASNAAKGRGFKVTLKHCDTSTGTYLEAGTFEAQIDKVQTGKLFLKFHMPISMKRYVKLSILALPTYYGKPIDITTASDTAVKVATAIVALATQFLPEWVVTRDGANVIFTADSNGVRSGSYKYLPGATGAAGTMTITTPGTADQKEVRNLLITAAASANGPLFFVLNDIMYGTATIPVVIASDSAAKVAAEIRALAKVFLPSWVVTGATDAVIFTADAVGVRNGTYAFSGLDTGVTGSIAETTAGEAAVKAVHTLTIATAVAVPGDLRITLNSVAYGAPVQMAGGSTFKAAVVTG